MSTPDTPAADISPSRVVLWRRMIADVTDAEITALDPLVTTNPGEVAEDMRRLLAGHRAARPAPPVTFLEWPTTPGGRLVIEEPPIGTVIAYTREGVQVGGRIERVAAGWIDGAADPHDDPFVAPWPLVRGSILIADVITVVRWGGE